MQRNQPVPPMVGSRGHKRNKLVMTWLVGADTGHSLTAKRIWNRSCVGLLRHGLGNRVVPHLNLAVATSHLEPPRP